MLEQNFNFFYPEVALMNQKRRPLKTRELALAKQVARWFSSQAITPNQISVFSLVFAALAGICLLAIPNAIGANRWALPLFSAIFIQGRLLCNLLDGMVAVEGGKQSRCGELFNDIPDRFADAIILVAAGYAITFVSWGGALGWCVALFAVMTAYVRTLAVSVGAPANFQGPMAKPHRMALLTVACLLTLGENGLDLPHYALFIALLLMLIGCIITLYRRIMAVYHYLEAA
jgi:phosphatidylglycerophosphate synthase